MNTYKMKLEDSVDSMIFDLLEVPIVDKDVEGAVDNTTVDGNVFTDYLWLKKNYVQKWSIMCDDEYSQLRGFYTRQFDNASVPTYKLYTGQNLSEDFIASGKYIMVNNTTDYNAPINSFQLLGDATQTTYSGKNLLNTNALNRTLPYTTTSNGITFKLDSDGSITMNGTNNGGGNSTFTIYNSATPLVLSGGSYTGDLNPTDGVYRAVSLVVYDGVHFRGFTQASTQTLDASNAQAYLQVVSGNTTNFSNYKIYPMLETGSTATAYEPYVGGTASPNPDYPQAVNTVTGEQTFKIEGKNLFDINRTLGTPSNTSYANTTPRTFDFTQYIKGISSNNYYAPNNITSSDVSNGNITLKTTQSAYGLGFAVPTLPSTTYRISYNVTPAGGVASIGYYQMTGEWISNYSPSNGVFVTPANCAFIVISFRGSGDNVETTYSKIQLELGNQASQFEPYQGQSLPVNLGKNLFSISQDTIISNPYLENNTTLTFPDQNSVKFVATGTQGAQYLYRIIKGLDKTQGYTFSFKGTKNVKGSSGLSYIRITPYGSNDGSNWTNLGAIGNTNPTQGETYSFTKSLGGYEQYRFMIFNNADTPVQVGETTTYSELQLELGSATTYAPYFTPIELCKIGDYQDYIYNDNGTWKIHKAIGKVVLNGTEDGWDITGGGNGYRLATSDIVLTPSGDLAPIMSNYYTITTFSRIYNANIDYGIANHNNNHWLVFRNKDITSLANFKTWLSTHPTTVYYALATPIETEIASSELVGQLEAILQAYLYTGTNNVSNNAVSPNLAGDLDLGYTLIYEKENIIIPQTSVRLTLTDGGVINVCGCRQNVQLGMRETIQ